MGREIVAVGSDGDRAVKVGPEELGAAIFQPGDGGRRRMTVGIAPAGADHRDPRRHLGDERVGRGGAAPMVSNLQHVEWRIRLGQPGGEEPWIDLFLDVAGEQHAPVAETNVEHERHVVDGRASVGRPQRDTARWRPPDRDAHAVESEMVPRGNDPRLAVELGHPAPEGGVTWAGADHSGFGDAADPVAIEQQRQSADVVLVRMGDDHQVEPPVPRRQPLVEEGEQAVRVGSGVDEDPAAGWSLEQDRVTLTHVEDGHVQPEIRPCSGRQRQDKGHDAGSTDGSGTQTRPAGRAVSSSGTWLRLRPRLGRPSPEQPQQTSRRDGRRGEVERRGQLDAGKR
jgi:hypothetical protein